MKVVNITEVTESVEQGTWGANIYLARKKFHAFMELEYFLPYTQSSTGPHPEPHKSRLLEFVRFILCTLFVRKPFVDNTMKYDLTRVKLHVRWIITNRNK
jgi:hypothetical protein